MLIYIYILHKTSWWGAGVAQWLERQTCDWKVPGLSPGRSSGRIFFSIVNFLCWSQHRKLTMEKKILPLLQHRKLTMEKKILPLLLFRYPFHPHVTAVARKRSRSFCQKCRWQVTAKHTYTLPMWLWMKWHCNLVNGWMVYTELAETAAFHVAPAIQHPQSATSTPLPWILIICTIKGYSHSFRITCQCAQWVRLRAENNTI